ncbi:MAG TPA: phosphatase PAP2 family protein [Anaerolineales bacterium]|nr:phosphatase PAP2 family protein [Anaerolineales bacterium]HLO33513.1 phosphatase PAP2 family protein [Anaerolineales bacterium]
MTSRAYPVADPKKNGFALSLNKRLLLLIFAYCIQSIYIPTSNRISGGIEPKLPIDIFPIWSVWVLPYVLCYALWFSSVIWIVLRMEDRLFRSFIAACIFTFTIGSTTFIFFPTYVKPALLYGNDIFTMILHFIHNHWGRYDAFPSGHVYITTLLALFFSRWYPRQKYIWILILVIVSFSTLFTGQHYILDVVGGYSIALAGYHFGLWWGGFYATQKRPNKRSEKRVTSSSFN